MVAGLATLNVDKRCFYRLPVSGFAIQLIGAKQACYVFLCVPAEGGLGSWLITNKDESTWIRTSLEKNKNISAMQGCSPGYVKHSQHSRSMLKIWKPSLVQSALSRKMFLCNLLKARKILESKQLSLSYEEPSL